MHTLKSNFEAKMCNV